MISERNKIGTPMPACRSHGKHWMDDQGKCLACEEIEREQMEEEFFRQQQEEWERREMEEHFRRHPHG